MTARKMDELSSGVIAEIMSEDDPETALSDSVDALVLAFGDARVREAVKEKLGI
jgi:hypothetical protein